MPKKRLSMRKLSEILRLHAAGLSARQIARSCGVARSTVTDHLERLKAAGLSWPLAPQLSDEELERRLFGGDSPTRTRDLLRPLADWPTIHKELALKGVTLKLLWQEHRQAHPDGYGYSQFCEYYQRWAQSLDVCLRQTYRAGERLFVDYAGLTVALHDPHSGQIEEAQIFVAALGASHYLYAEATRSQQLADWIEAHIHTFEHLEGVTEITTPDNLKSGVARACRYDPDINPTYQDMATHYPMARVRAGRLKVHLVACVAPSMTPAKLRSPFAPCTPAYPCFSSSVLSSFRHPHCVSVEDDTTPECAPLRENMILTHAGPSSYEWDCERVCPLGFSFGRTATSAGCDVANTAGHGVSVCRNRRRPTAFLKGSRTS